MKKNFKIIHFYSLLCMIFLFVSILNLSTIQKAKALAQIDQVCSIGVAGTTGYTFLSHEPYQIFVPTKDTLDAVGVYIKADASPSATVRLQVINAVTGQSLGTKDANITDQWSWVTFDMNDTQMPNAYFAIAIAEITGHAVWKHGPTSCYDRGYAVYDNVEHLELDYGFAVYTYNATTGNPGNGTAAPPANSTSQGTATTGTSKGTGKAPAAQTSSSLSPPKNLTASDIADDNGGKIMLKWERTSTTSFDGYQIYRSENANSGFVEIARTLPIVGGYIDENATTDKTFYYLMRTYKGNSESASSNIAQAKSIDNLSWILDDFKNQKSGLFGSMLGSTILVVALILGLIFLRLFY